MPAASTPAVILVAPEPVTPHFWDEACKHLSKRDRVMRKLIPQFGKARLHSRGDAFTTLARSIVGQQISVQAAQAVWERLLQLLALTPDHDGLCVSAHAVLACDAQALKSAGLSARKVEYLLDLATQMGHGRLDPQRWPEMSDEAIIEQLVSIRGIGRWTADMFLIFHMLRANVLPLDDLGLIKALSLNYFSGEPVSRAEAREIAEAWHPYRTVGTWYLWRSLDPQPVAY